jgi:hypothetical protein
MSCVPRPSPLSNNLETGTLQVDWDRHTHSYIALAWYRRQNGGGTPTRPNTPDLTNRPTDQEGLENGIREGISTCSIQTSSHHPTITSLPTQQSHSLLQPFLPNQPNQPKWPSSRLSSSPPWPLLPSPLRAATPRSPARPWPPTPSAATVRSSPAATAARTSSVPTA